MDGWLGTWVEVKTFLRIDCSNDKHQELQKQSEKKGGCGRDEQDLNFSASALKGTCCCQVKI